MKKNLMSFILAAAMVSAPAIAFADEPASPTVIVDNAPILFYDQPAIIQDDRTLVPARGVFEAMGADVKWDGDTHMVEVTSPDNVTIVRLYIDNPVMEVYTFTNSLFSADKKEVTLDVGPQVLNDRTVIPLRAISEALDASVIWDGDTFTVDIKTNRRIKTEDETLKVSLSSDVDTVEAGETFDLYVDLSNMALYPDCWVATITTGVKYDKENFEVIGSTFLNNDVEITDSVGIYNPDYHNDSVRSVHSTINIESAMKADGHIMKLTIKSLTGKEGSFELKNRYDSLRGEETSIILEEGDDFKQTVFAGTTLVVDETPVIINAGK